MAYVKKRQRKYSKYRVQVDDSGKRNRTVDGILFDSLLEKRYYVEVVLPLFESGEIVNYELQKKYELQPSFKYGNETIRAIVYIADFFITYKNGDVIIWDTKGKSDSISKLKKKLFHYRYPELDYRWITYSKMDGGWVDYDYLQKQRQKRKKEKRGRENK